MSEVGLYMSAAGQRSRRPQVRGRNGVLPGRASGTSCLIPTASRPVGVRSPSAVLIIRVGPVSNSASLRHLRMSDLSPGPNPDIESREDTNPKETEPRPSAPISFVSFVLSWFLCRLQGPGQGLTLTFAPVE